MSHPSINLYIDIVSPFGYIAYYLTRHSPAFTSIPTTYTPILLGGLMHQTGGTGPLSIRNKSHWIESERLRLASALDVPMRSSLPDGFPIPTIKCQRVLVYFATQDATQGATQDATQDATQGATRDTTQSQQSLTTAIDALYHALWVDGRNVNDESVLREVLGKCFDAEVVERTIRESSNESAKVGLKENTAAAYREGAFGLPWFVASNADGERKGFWGVDRVGSVLAWVGRREVGERFGRAML